MTMKEALQQFLRSSSITEDDRKIVLQDINFILWYLHEAQQNKTFDFNEFESQLKKLSQMHIVSISYIQEIWKRDQLISAIVDYFEIKKKRYVDYE